MLHPLCVTPSMHAYLKGAQNSSIWHLCCASAVSLLLCAGETGMEELKWQDTTSALIMADSLLA